MGGGDIRFPSFRVPLFLRHVLLFVIFVFFQVIKDLQLFGLVAVLLFLVVLILMLWEVIDPLRIKQERENQVSVQVRKY